MLIGSLLFYSRIPGNNTFTDNDGLPIAMGYGIFLLIGIGLVLNSYYFIIKNHLKKIRIGILVLVIGGIIMVLIPREFLIYTFLGNQKSELISVNTKETDYIWVDMKFYENDTFLCSSTNFNLTVENIGKYKLTNSSLHLTYENEQSKFLGTTFQIENDTLYCLDCNTALRLVKKQ